MEVVVDKAPFESVVTITIPESVSGSPLAFVVVKVVVKVVNGGFSKDEAEAETSGTNADVVVVKAPF